MAAVGGGVAEGGGGGGVSGGSVDMWRGEGEGNIIGIACPTSKQQSHITTTVTHHNNPHDSVKQHRGCSMHVQAELQVQVRECAVAVQRLHGDRSHATLLSTRNPKSKT